MSSQVATTRETRHPNSSQTIHSVIRCRILQGISESLRLQEPASSLNLSHPILTPPSMVTLDLTLGLSDIYLKLLTVLLLPTDTVLLHREDRNPRLTAGLLSLCLLRHPFIGNSLLLEPSSSLTLLFQACSALVLYLLFMLVVVFFIVATDEDSLFDQVLARLIRSHQGLVLSVSFILTSHQTPRLLPPSLS